MNFKIPKVIGEKVKQARSINWKSVWTKFNSWHKAEEKKSDWVVEWPAQRKKIAELVEQEIKPEEKETFNAR